LNELILICHHAASGTWVDWVGRSEISGVWSTVIMIINMELAHIPPPEGLDLFVLQDMTNATVGE
jgi:TRAP-type C4-dicarboxylate transport system permease large subunit